MTIIDFYGGMQGYYEKVGRPIEEIKMLLDKFITVKLKLIGDPAKGTDHIIETIVLTKDGKLLLGIIILVITVIMTGIGLTLWNQRKIKKMLRELQAREEQKDKA